LFQVFRVFKSNDFAGGEGVIAFAILLKAENGFFVGIIFNGCRRGLSLQV
jgi:hypothetical protein